MSKLTDVLEELLETDINEHPNCTCDGCKEIRERIAQAEPKLKQLFLEWVGEDKLTMGYPGGNRDRYFIAIGYNSRGAEIRERIGE